MLTSGSRIIRNLGSVVRHSGRGWSRAAVRRAVAIVSCAALLGGAGLFAGAISPTREAREVEIPLTVRKFAFTPPRLAVEAGDRITFKIRSLDITHGFSIEGTGVNTTILPGRETRVTVVAEKPGKIRYRCTVVCGPLHPYMVGEVIVRPNLWPLWGGGLALLVGFLASSSLPRSGPRWNLLRWRPLHWLLTRRWLQFALIAPNLFAFTLIILAGLVGTQTGAMNFSTIFVWLVWWGLLVLLLIPLGGRIWCAACPISAPGEWLARRAIIDRSARSFSLGWAWPKRLRNLWPAFGGLLLVILFSLIITTRPLVTALLLLGLALVALVTYLVFERSAFCRYLCPVGGLLGIYSMAAPLELRAEDSEICRACKEKSCYRGGSGYPCPTFQYPGSGLTRNTYCLLCTECLKACPYNNLALRLRGFGADLLVARGRRADEAWMALLLLGSALVYSVIKLGPWGWIKSWANLESPTEFILYTALFAGVVLGALPALLLSTAWLSRRLAGDSRVPLRRLFVHYAYAVIPLSLGAWVAFTLAVVFPNLSYIPRVLSDPFGWGWDLFGTREATWSWAPLALLSWAQLAALGVGLWASVRAGRVIVLDSLSETLSPRRGTAPLVLFLMAIAWAFLILYLG